MTWDHPRAWQPLEACSDVWRREHGVEIAWDRRSLQDFESFPVEELAERYDLIVIDHPHVGQIVRERCLVRLDAADRADERAALEAGSVGASFASYRFGDALWALPLDAATQVQAWRPDRLAGPARTWEEILALAGEGRVALPLRPPHSLMSLYTLCGQVGESCRAEGPVLMPPATGERAYDLLAELVARVPANSFALDPIEVLDAMGTAASATACAPLVYGYANYARDDFREARIGFADVPAVAGSVAGSALGGTGIAVSAFSEHVPEAIAFAFWVASGAVQSGLYAEAGGQPAHAQAWESDAVNAPVADFYRATRRTLDQAWVRPRHDGYMAFQHEASLRLNAGLQAGEPAATVVAALNAMFAASLRA
jgi:multiple sugar transport system substrate-binding protein